MSTWPVNDDGVVSFPDGLCVKGGSWRRFQRSAQEPPDFLVLLLGYEPDDVPCPYVWVRWLDFWTPASTREAITALRAARERAGHERVAIMCGGGVGRTGSALAVLAAASGVPADEAVEWVREHYHPRAVETPWQRRWVCDNAQDV